MGVGIVIAVGDTDQPKTPFWARCGENVCRHAWIAAYLPMEMTAAAKLLAKASCPMCGSSTVFVARQLEGELVNGGMP